MNNATYSTLSVGCLLVISMVGCSRILLVDPPTEQDVVATPHDLVVGHFGCGTSEIGSLQVFLNEGKPDQIELTEAFHYDRRIDAWVAESYDLPEGQHHLTARARISSGTLCYPLVTGTTREWQFVAALPNGIVESQLYNADDVDRYAIKSQPVGSDFGSWFEVTVEAIDPPNYDLHAKLVGPAGSHLVSTTQSSTQFWIALKKDVAAEIVVQKGAVWPAEQRFVTYRITVASGVIPDSLEDDDTEPTANQLVRDVPRFAYMCGVMDGLEATVGLRDCFWYDHESCIDDCVRLSQNAYIENCLSIDKDDCDGCFVEGTQLCMKAGGCMDFIDPGRRYVRVRHPKHNTYECYGRGSVPDQYRVPYSITLYSLGDVGDYSDCAGRTPK